MVAFTQVKSVEHMVKKKSISNAHFVVFLSRRCQNVENRPWNLFPFKNVLFFDHRVRNVPQVSSETSLPWLVQNKPSENEVEFLERQFHSEKLLFVHKKDTEHSFELSLSICAFHQRTFKLEMQTFSLENHHIMNARQPFCWWMTFTKVSNPFLPSPPKWLTWPLDVFEGVAGMGDFTDLDCIGRI